MQHRGVVARGDDPRKAETIRRVHQHLPLKKPLHLIFLIELLEILQGFLERFACNRLRLEGVGNIVSIQRQSQPKVGLHDIAEASLRRLNLLQQTFNSLFEFPVMIGLDGAPVSAARTFKPEGARLFLFPFR